MKIHFNGKEIEINNDKKTVKEIFENEIKASANNVIACVCNNEVKSLEHEVKDNDKIELLDITDKDGMRIYIRGLLYIMSMAFYRLYPNIKVKVNYQLSNAMFCEIEGAMITEEIIKNVKDKMQEIISKNLPIKKVIMDKEEAKEFYEKENSIRGRLQVRNKEKESLRISEFLLQFYIEKMLNLKNGKENVQFCKEIIKQGDIFSEILEDLNINKKEKHGYHLA